MKWNIDKTDVQNMINNNGDVCIRLRYRFYLEPTEKHYEKWYVKVKKLKSDSKGKIELTKDDFELTGEEINNAFHNHIIELPQDVTDDFITNIGNQLYSIIKEYYDLGYYDNDELVFIPNTIPRYYPPTDENIQITTNRCKELIKNELWQ